MTLKKRKKFQVFVVILQLENPVDWSLKSISIRLSSGVVCLLLHIWAVVTRSYAFIDEISTTAFATLTPHSLYALRVNEQEDYNRKRLCQTNNVNVTVSHKLWSLYDMEIFHIITFPIFMGDNFALCCRTNALNQLEVKEKRRLWVYFRLTVAVCRWEQDSSE